MSGWLGGHTPHTNSEWEKLTSLKECVKELTICLLSGALPLENDNGVNIQTSFDFPNRLF